ncbi:MAG: tetratricopeptide repeat protein [Bryobacteraceae bacterium]|nr:tetratricopeptide repeat protein [Bryobacteraceae bacterium]
MTGVLVGLLLLAPPEDAERLSSRALAAAQAGRPDEAEALWKQALAAAPGHFPSLFNYGFLLFNGQRFQEAEALLARAAKANPKDFNTRFILGSTLLKLLRREDALVQWRAALALQPSNIRLMQVMSVEYTAGRYFNEACALGQRAVKIKGDAPEPWLIAIKACQDAQNPAAFTLAEQAAAKFPQSARAVFEYAFHLQRAGRREEALPLLEKAIKLDPSYEEPLFFSGDLLLLEDRHEDAAERLRAALRIRPDYVPACVSLAKALMALERYQEAVSELEACAKASPSHPQPHLLLSQVFFRLGDEARSRAEKEISFRLRRENPALMEAPQARPFPAVTTARR